LQSNQPLVTVGVALYNHEKYIVDCLKSIVEQTFTDVELIVIDDGSSDNSYEVAKSYLQSQERIKYIIKTRKNVGMCNTLNEIAHLSHGKYISFIGSDDYWAKDKIQDQVEFLENHLEIALVHSNSIMVDDHNNEISTIEYQNKKNSSDLFEAILFGKGGINTPSHLYRTSVYEEIGYYDPSFRFEDTDFWLRVTSKFKVGFINKFHTYYRWHDDNLSGNANKLKFYNDEIVRIYRKNIVDGELKQKAISRIYKKSLLVALRTLKVNYFLKYFTKYILCRFFAKC